MKLVKNMMRSGKRFGSAQPKLIEGFAPKVLRVGVPIDAHALLDFVFELLHLLQVLYVVNGRVKHVECQLKGII